MTALIMTLFWIGVIGLNVFLALRIIKGHKEENSFYWAIGTAWFGVFAYSLFKIRHSGGIKSNQPNASNGALLRKFLILEGVLPVILFIILKLLDLHVFHGDVFAAIPSLILLFYIWLLPFLTFLVFLFSSRGSFFGRS